MHVVCSHCHAEFEAPYWQFGLRKTCPACHQLVALDHQTVRSWGTFLWDTSYQEFVQLVTYPFFQETILPLLHEWLGYDLILTDGVIRFRDAGGAVHDAESVHTQIQQNAQWQYGLYQAAYPLRH